MNEHDTGITPNPFDILRKRLQKRHGIAESEKLRYAARQKIHNRHQNMVPRPQKRHSIAQSQRCSTSKCSSETPIGSILGCPRVQKNINGTLQWLGTEYGCGWTLGVVMGECLPCVHPASYCYDDFRKLSPRIHHYRMKPLGTPTAASCLGS